MDDTALWMYYNIGATGYLLCAARHRLQMVMWISWRIDVKSMLWNCRGFRSKLCCNGGLTGQQAIPDKRESLVASCNDLVKDQDAAEVM